MTSVDRLAKLAAPTGRRVSRAPRFGDGPICPTTPSHGATYLTRDRLSFLCPHQTHDASGRPAVWPNTPEA